MPPISDDYHSLNATSRRPAIGATSAQQTGQFTAACNDEMFLSWLRAWTYTRFPSGNRGVLRIISYFTAVRKALRAGDSGLGCSRWAADPGPVLGVEPGLDGVELAPLEVGNRHVPPRSAARIM